MTCLLYCVFRSGGGEGVEGLRGVEGRPVSLVSRNGLSAACSRLASPEAALDVARAMAYQKVIDSFHGDRTVIPMRYGCLFDDPFQIARHLEECSRWYRSLLDELNGCVEMGIRVLFFGENRDSGLDSPSDLGGSGAIKAAPTLAYGPGSGREYLAARRCRYAREERAGERKKMVVERCRQALAGLFRKFMAEDSSLTALGPPLGSPFLSLYFLTPRNSVEPFRRAFRQIGTIPSAKLLLSGPWPPYNFVLPKNQSERPVVEEVG